MSHMVSLKVRGDLESVKQAFECIGGVFHENVTTYRWTGRDYRDSRWPPLLKRKGYSGGVFEVGECHHKVSFPGADFEVGVVFHEGEYHLLWDYVDAPLFKIMGGPAAPNFAKAHAECLTNRRLAQIAETYKAKGKKVTFETQPNTSIKKLVIKWPA